MEQVEFERVRVKPTGLVSRRDAATALGKSPKTLCEWSAKGVGPKPRKVGGRIFYDWQDVVAFASGQTAVTFEPVRD